MFVCFYVFLTYVLKHLLIVFFFCVFSLIQNEVLEQQLKEITQQNAECKERKGILESELKQYIDKVFDLRETICNLETQIQEKGINEIALEEEVKVGLLWYHRNALFGILYFWTLKFLKIMIFLNT